MNNKISVELAEILGLLCAEGSHIVSYSSYWEKNRGVMRFRRNKKSERIEFYNKDKKLLIHYNQLLLKEFGIQHNETKHGKINIGNRKVISEIIQHTKLGHLSWSVPSSVIQSNKIVKLRFVRGFFDGDGTAINVARFFSTNKKGLGQISQLLFDLNYKHTIQRPVIKPNRKPHYVL